MLSPEAEIKPLIAGGEEVSLAELIRVCAG